MSRYITGVDIGTATIKVAVAEVVKGSSELKVVSLSQNPARGLRKGVICHLDEAEQSIGSALERARNLSKAAIKNVYLNVGGNKSKTQVAKGMVVVSRADNEIYHDDIDRVIKASEDVARTRNRVIIHTLTREFSVDGMPSIEDPVGLVGNKLEVETFVVDAFSPDVRHLERVIAKAQGMISGMIFNPIAASQSVLTKNQKDLGVVMIDIGAGTTSVSVYEEGKLLHAAVLPIGSANVTQDIAIGLKTSLEVAEALKLSIGYAVAKGIPAKEKLNIKKFDPDSKGSISRRFFSEIIEMRLQEIFELINNELKSIGKSKDLPAGAVLTGGGAKMPGIVELAKQELKLPAQIGIVSEERLLPGNSDLGEKMEDPEYATVLGLVLQGVETEKSHRNRTENPFIRFLNYFLP